MHQTKFKPSDALKEHLLSGRKTSILEAQVLFGVTSLSAEIGRLRRAGFILQRKNVPIAKVVRRINQICALQLPHNLPAREIMVSEYWIENI